MTEHKADSAQAFFEITPDKVLAAVERLGVRCSGRVLALNSMENRVYEVELDLELAPKAPKWEAFRVIKFYRPGRWSKEQILEEHEFLREAAVADLPVVVPLTFPSGATLEILADSQIYFAVFPKVGGRLSDELTEAELEQIGRLLGRLHGVGSAHPFKYRSVLTVKSYGYDNLEYLSQNKLIPATVETHFLRIAERIFKTTEPWFSDVAYQRIHGDCHLGNILWLWSKCSVVDFDDSLMGPCVQDLWLLTPGRDQDSLRRQEVLLRGYSSMRPFDHGCLRLREPLRALRMVHFTTWIAKRFEDPAFNQVFVDYGSERYWREQLIAIQEVGETLGIG